MSSLPIQIKSTRKVFADLAACEQGRLESYNDALEAGDQEEAEGLGPVYTCSLAERAALTGVMVVATAEEATDVYYSVSSGTFKIGHYGVAVRIADALRDAVRAHDPEMVARWAYPARENEDKL